MKGESVRVWVVVDWENSPQVWTVSRIKAETMRKFYASAPPGDGYVCKLKRATLKVDDDKKRKRK